MAIRPISELPYIDALSELKQARLKLLSNNTLIAKQADMIDTLQKQLNAYIAINDDGYDCDDCSEGICQIHYI